MQTQPQQAKDRYILRFERPGHREQLKAMAAREKRSLNKQILLLIEAGEAVANQRSLNGEVIHRLEQSRTQQLSNQPQKGQQ